MVKIRSGCLEPAEGISDISKLQLGLPGVWR